MTHVPAAPGTFILTLDDDGTTILRTPVVAFSVEGTIAYPIAPIAINGLLKAKRALLVGEFVIDRGFHIPFGSEAEWVQWAGAQTPEVEPDAEEQVIDMTGVVGRQQAAARAQAAQPKPPGIDTSKPRKTFASKSFWSKTNVNGSVEIAEIAPGYGLPRDHEGWEKIKREEFADFKRQSKAGEPVDVIEWGKDGPVEPADIIDPHEDAVGDTSQEAEVIEDDTGLV